MKVSTDEMRSAIRSAGGLPMDAALELLEVSEKWAKTARAGREACERLGTALDIARDALDTYAQFSDGGEHALVSGRFAREALAKIGRGEA